MMRKLILITTLAMSLISTTNAQINTSTSDNKDSLINVLAFSKNENDKVSADNVLNGKNEFLVIKIHSNIASNWHSRANQKFFSINNQEYAVLERVEDLTALENKNDRDGKLDKKDKSFTEIYAASFVSAGNDQKLKLAKFSDQASAILIKNGFFVIKSKKISDFSKGSVIGIKAQRIRIRLVPKRS